jgi:hypothetical protein
MGLITLFVITILGLLICYLIFDNTAFIQGEIIVTPVVGILIGLHNSKIEEEDEIHHSWQFSLFFVIITFNWVTIK